MEHSQHINPFVGLKAFEESEDYLFFGRGKEIDDLVKKFSENRFLAVIGSSGSGKSSLVKSGMLPQIYGGFMKTGGNWRVALMQPGENPIGYLARQLAREGVLYTHIENSEIPYESVIESRLRRSENGLQLAYSDAHLPDGENLLVVVDQFEELFRFSKYEKENKVGKSDAMQFIQILLTAARQAQYPIYVLLTMRSDFLGDCAEFRGLPEAINNGQYLVPRMTRDEIREAITGPVAVSNATISQRLVTRLLNDINNDTDQLPVLQHAMMRTWDAWFQRGLPDISIDFEDYEKIGTMKSALSQHADEAYGELTNAEEQRVCEMMFKSLTDTSADLRGIRRPRSITDLCIITGATQHEIKKQVEIFRKPGRTFLMPPQGVDLSDDTIIDISHESLMRIWLRLVNWTEEEARSGDLYLRLASSAQLWKTGQRGLLKDPELGIALKWKDVNKPTVKWAEGFKADFQKTMVYLEESRLKALEEKKIAARTKLIKAVFTFLVLGAVATTLILNAQKNTAEGAKNEALAQKNEALAQKKNALQAKNYALEQTKQAMVANLAADSAKREALGSAKTAREKELEARKSAEEARILKDLSIVQKTKADQLKEQAIINTIKNAPSEYARLIREGPLNKKEIQASAFDLKLPAYAEHLDILGRLVRLLEEKTKDEAAVKKYDDLLDRLYYNNDLYEKVYACMETIPDPSAKKKLFNNDVPFKGAFRGDVNLSNPTFDRVNKEVRLLGKNVNKIIEDKKTRRVLCATDDNWIFIYGGINGKPVLESKIPMGAPVTALDYNAEKNIIYFGLKTGNIGYIKYDKNKKNQLAFENYLGSPIVAIQWFRAAVKGETMNFLLVAAEKSKVVVYKLDDYSLQPDKNLFGNTLPEKKLGLLTNAQFDNQLQQIIIKGQSQKSTSSNFYTWNPFTAPALEEYKLALEAYKNYGENAGMYSEQTNIYK